ncbi:cobyric acid synthase [Halomicrobium mukohataei]|uniref:Probable cobyric acid synthase n=1 Tax=Halomicrobium mukohataei TaxID=57705 RepID=A0A847UCF0_9EURY|nr:cobyric acid synthase [Halomicrobium mukohataei]NLV10146.1 cobyric acid synthase [Halomicrobium mukohataei]
MTTTILVAGTASHVGKSTVVAGLCRLLAGRGVSVAPFKAQNMSNNAHAVATPDGDWGEIGVSQYVQARAAGITPTTDTNPVLLKPRGDGESQLVIDGEAIGHYEARTYYDDHWEHARSAARDAYERLADEYNVIVAEGAGSAAEINLQDRDLANVETARFTDASVLVLGDIERGGVFASLYGTLELAPAAIRERVAGVAITKFRGDPTLLADGIDELEARTGVPVLGVLPYDDPGLPAEDSLSLPARDQRAVVGADDGVPDAATVTVGVPRLPHISNFTDLEPLAAVPGVRVAYCPLDGALDRVDGLVLPGTKNTVDDLLALREAGLDEAIRTFAGPIVGLCGGYQLLGERITNASVEGTGDAETVAGVGRLPVETRFSETKRVEQVSVAVDGVGPIEGATGTASGYEIHMGETSVAASAHQPLGPDSAATQDVLGTYIHGLFENEQVRSAFVDAVYAHADRTRPSSERSAQTPFDDAAALVRELDLSALDLPAGRSES